MDNILAVVNLNASSGFADDDIVNTFAIRKVGWDGSFPGAVTLAIANFYNGSAPTTAHPVSWYLSNHLDRTALAHAIGLYDITGHENGEPHGSPFFVDHFTLGVGDASSRLPTEVALAITLKTASGMAAQVEVADNADPLGVDDADDRPDRPKQRRTGRLFMGPLNMAALDGSTGRPSATVLPDFAKAAQALKADLDAVAAPGPFTWSVWSRKNRALTPITAWAIDNAFDTQRRRGIAPTAKYTLP